MSSTLGSFQGPQGEEGVAGTDQRVVCILVTHPDDLITPGDAQGAPFWVVPAFAGMVLVHAFAGLDTTGTGTSTVQIRNVTQGWDMLSTPITIDSTEATSLTAAAPPTIDTAKDDLALGDKIVVDIDGIGTGAQGLVVELTFETP